MGAFLARRQYNSPILYIRVQWIARADIEAAAQWAWKNDLSLRGNFGLHGKTILPRFSSLGNRKIRVVPLENFEVFERAGIIYSLS